MHYGLIFIGIGFYVFFIYIKKDHRLVLDFFVFTIGLACVTIEFLFCVALFGLMKNKLFCGLFVLLFGTI
jgi:hypothetical protein